MPDAMRTARLISIIIAAALGLGLTAARADEGASACQASAVAPHPEGRTALRAFHALEALERPERGSTALRADHAAYGDDYAAYAASILLMRLVMHASDQAGPPAAPGLASNDEGTAAPRICRLPIALDDEP